MDYVVLNPYVAWIAGFPLLGAVLNGFLLSWIGRLLPRATRERLLSRQTVHIVAVFSVFFSFLVAVGAAIQLWVGNPFEAGDPVPTLLLARLWNWLPLSDLASGVPGLRDVLRSPELSVPLAFGVDRLSAMMALTVSGVSFLIHVYSAGYMAHDASYRRYFAYLNLFVFFMLVLVLADNLVLMFVGWEGVGLCSYLLIGFWFDKEANAAAGKKAFIVNRIGDLGFLLGIFCLAAWLGTVRFHGVTLPTGMTLPGMSDLVGGKFGTGPLPAHTALGVSGAFLAGLLLFVGAMGKSAQIPLYVWLPDAMAGPTPVSALIHAATMVTAGVYMIARLDFLYLLSPTVMAVVATVGAATALFAAVIGLAQNDIKKVLAYSTISQLGYMFLAVGVGAFGAGLFHLFTHAFFKACLFLCAGAVIHALQQRQDIREMGGLRKRLPVVHWTFLASTLAIAGFPPFSGFFSKDEILWSAFSGTAILRSGVVPFFWPLLLYVVGLVAAGLTAFYMFRLYFLVFWGELRAPGEVGERLGRPDVSRRGSFLWTDPHTPVSMRVVLIVLGVGAAAGFVGMPHVFQVPNLFARWLAPVVSPFVGFRDEGMEVLLICTSVGVALFGALLAARFYREWPSVRAQRVMAAAPSLYRLVADKFRIDELYGWLVVRPARFLAFVAYEVIDRALIDTALVGGVGWLARGIGGAFRRLQGGVIHRYAAMMAVGVAGVLYFAASPFATVPVVERPVQFVRAIPVDPTTGAVRLVFTMPAAPYRYEIDLDGDGAAEAELDPRAPVPGPGRLRGDVVQACLPEGRHEVVVTARSRFELVRRLVVPVEVTEAPRCALWSLIDDPRLARAPRPFGWRGKEAAPAPGEAASAGVVPEVGASGTPGAGDGAGTEGGER